MSGTQPPTDTQGVRWTPPSAGNRLAAKPGANSAGAFTSDLSVSEYVLLGESGFELLGFVVGSSIYHVGVAIQRWSENQEIAVLTQAMYSARELAMSRMRAEAEMLGADGVVGVQLLPQSYVWATGVLEFVAAGTAVRSITAPGQQRAPNGQPFTSDLSAQDFYEARELALVRMQTEATEPGASGIVGTKLMVEARMWGEHATEFLATGTAIRQLSEDHRLAASAPKPAFTLGLDS